MKNLKLETWICESQLLTRLQNKAGDADMRATLMISRLSQLPNYPHTLNTSKCLHFV